MAAQISNVSLLIVKILSEKGALSIGEILKEVKKIDKDVLYTDIERNIRNKSVCLFKRVKRGIYALVDCKIKKRIPIEGLSVDNTSPKKHNESKEKVLNIENHMGFIKRIATRAAKLFGLEIEDIFGEAVALAYEYKDRYDPKKGNPTTFLNSQITTRLYNKIKRELLPNYFQVIKGEDGEKEGKRILVSQQSLYVPVNNSKSGNSEKETFLIDCITKEQVDEGLDYGENSQDTESLIESRNACEKIRSCLRNSGLSENEVVVVEKRFGLDGKGEKTLEQVGDEVNLTKERVRQVVKGVCKKLKNKHILKEIYGMVD